ncbi:PREDICTED: enhancer of mRNA-decapping protein 4-like, partial [Amphimedon queenslandica]|uniref:Enhancer of mRNA-decapping protein 4 WD40 repeat region domain-containing protein n=1 Tax=Amphimedon queenslandica TaxID=400682 RepID=A0A1X7SUX9_AMPQE
VRVKTITNQNWEPKRFRGNIVASNSQYLAYVLASRSGYVIRLIHLQTNDRALLKKFNGEILDISFAHNHSNLLGVIDEAGNLYVYDIDKTNGDINKINDCLKLHIFNGVIPDGKTHLLVWAPYIQTQQDNGDDDNVMIAVSHDSRVIDCISN